MPLQLDQTRLELLTISLLRGSFDTGPARSAWSILADDPSATFLVERIASETWSMPGAAPSEIARARAEAERAIEWTRDGVTFLTLLDEKYPQWLRNIPDPPLVLWVDGSTDVLASIAVGVVGSRDALPVSLAIARKLGRELSDAGVTVVSGLAVGVDAASHVGALEGVGSTVAVLGSGLANVYPRLHRPLAERIRDRGAVITEFPPDAMALKTHFPLRNRIISGLSRGIVVVEASEKSGSLITADAALGQNRDVMAVPGGPLSGRHRGSNALIKDGARLVETVEDILDEIRWTGGALKQKDRKPLQLSKLESVMALGETYSIDELAGRTGRIAGDLVAELGALEVDGRVTRVPGGHFARFPR